MSLDAIVAAELAAADAAGDAVVQEPPKAATETPPTGDAPATETPVEGAPAEGEPAPEADKPVDDVTARRVRTMLAEIEKRTAQLDARDAAGGTTAEQVVADFLRAPKAYLAKYGKTIDDAIDASIAEGKAPEPPAADDSPRLTALEKRIEAREHAERQATINTRVAEIQREITTSGKYPLITEAKSAGLVTDYMLEYHAAHGKPIAWDKAAAAVEKDLTGMGIAAAKKLGWAPPAPKPAAVPARADTPTIGGSARDAAPTTGDEPEDPEQLLKYLVAQAGL